MDVSPSSSISGVRSALLLRQAAEALQLALSETQIAQFLTFRTMLQDWNTRVNLTAITDGESIITRHFIDSLTCLYACPSELRSRSLRLLDIGSGAGLPGLALAIAQPQWTVMSMEATGKKVRFQEAVITELGLTNARVAHGRAEVYAHENAWRGSFAIVTARALAALPTLLEWCEPFAQKDGLIIAPKKGDVTPELEQGARAARILGGAAPDVIPLPAALTDLIPDMADGRALVRVRQLTPTSPRYPRAGATPTKSPLGQ